VARGPGVNHRIELSSVGRTRPAGEKIGNPSTIHPYIHPPCPFTPLRYPPPRLAHLAKIFLPERRACCYPFQFGVRQHTLLFEHLDSLRSNCSIQPSVGRTSTLSNGCAMDRNDRNLLK
jgi:hypothetical protein